MRPVRGDPSPVARRALMDIGPRRRALRASCIGSSAGPRPPILVVELGDVTGSLAHGEAVALGSDWKAVLYIAWFRRLCGRTRVLLVHTLMSMREPRYKCRPRLCCWRAGGGGETTGHAFPADLHGRTVSARHIPGQVRLRATYAQLGTACRPCRRSLHWRRPRQAATEHELSRWRDNAFGRMPECGGTRLPS